MEAITGWTIGRRYLSGKYSVRLFWRDKENRVRSSQLLGQDGTDALFDTEREAMAAIRGFTRPAPKAKKAPRSAPAIGHAGPIPARRQP